MNIRSIAIRFGDNDFGMTFLPLLETVMRALDDWWGEEEFTRADVTRIINDGVMFHYKAFQCRGNYLEDRLDHLEDYLKVPERKVFINDEADQMSMEWNNSETFYISKYIRHAISV